MPTLSVVIPFYNEPSLRPLLDRLATVENDLKKTGLDAEFIFVDDGSHSRDGVNELIAFKKKYKDPPELLLEMAEKWQSGAKFVICVRSGRDDPASTRFFAWLYYRLVRVMAIRDFPPSGFDLALMDKSLLPHLQSTSVMINYRLLAYWLGLEPAVIEYKREKRMAGETHWGLTKRINLFIDSLIGFSVWPARAITILGLLSILVAKGYAIWDWINGGVLSATNPTFALSTVVIFAGLIMVALGIVAEYLWRIFFLLAGKPEVVIEEIY
jgi:glycosyltransferase involved in cell wall biosynthesis